MSTPAQLIRHTPGSGRAYSAVGDRYVMLATADQTSGAYCLLEATVPPGGGPPPHHHTREEEAFYVLEGEITFSLGEEKILGTAGAFIQIPRGAVHAFRNESGAPARMLIHCTPAGFDRFIAECGTELGSADALPIPPSPAEIERLMEIAPKYGLVIAPPPAH